MLSCRRDRWRFYSSGFSLSIVVHFWFNLFDSNSGLVLIELEHLSSQLVGPDHYSNPELWVWGRNLRALALQWIKKALSDQFYTGTKKMITSRDSNSNRPLQWGRLPMSDFLWMNTKLSHNNQYIFVSLKEHDPILREVVIWCPILFFQDKREVKCSPFRVRDVVKARWLVFRRPVTVLLFTG